MWHDLWSKHQRAFMFAVGMVCFLTAGLVVVNFPYSTKNQTVSNNVPQAEPRVVNADVEREEGFSSRARSSAALSSHEPQSEYVLYITGAVRRPGVYSLPAESRLLQLVEAAGGLSVSADPVAVNLAAVLTDGLHVHVPEKGEEPPANRAYGVPISAPGTPKAGAPVNINRASAEELTALKGIGPVLAGNILEYRLNNGRFHEIDDLLHVKGIGRVKLEQLRNTVTVGP